MLNLDLLLDIAAETEEQQRVVAGEGPLLAAALAATLLEYRRYAERRSGANGTGSGGATWRTLSRLEQLVRPAHHTVRGRA